MDKTMRNFEDALLDIHIDNYDLPSKEFLDLPEESLNDEQYNQYKRKKRQSKLFFQQVDHSALLSLSESLESGFYVPKHIQEKLKIDIRYDAISVWDRRHIKWQSAAQVLWYLNPKHNLKTIQSEIKGFDERLINYLDIDCLTSIMDKGNSRGRGLSDIIKLVAPSGSVKRGRPSKDTNEDCKTHLVLISKVYNPATQQVNFKALKIAIEAIVKTLLHQKVPPSEILLHPILVQYKKVAGLCEIVVDWWIQEVFQNE